MRKNYSPWIHQLKRNRVANIIDKNFNTDIIIIGGGIAGCMSAYQIINNTGHHVTLIDCNYVGHGSTGHNAGQLTTYFERPLADIATEFGVAMATEGQADVESAWNILEQIQKKIKLETPIYTFTGYAGLTELKQILLHLADNMIRYDGGIAIEKLYISENFKFLHEIPEIYSHLYEITTHEFILNLLETDNHEYIAALAYKKGATNSAKISEEIVNYLIDNYSHRFKVYENSPVNRIILNYNSVSAYINFGKKDFDILDKDADHIITGNKIILCTNGFEGFKIINNTDGDIDGKFHADVDQLINFMSAYIDKANGDPVAISYFPKENVNKQGENIDGESYYYMTRRPHTHDGVEMGLISTGGPERYLKSGEQYNRDGMCEEWAEQEIDKFLKHNYRKHLKGDIKYDFCWHGVLGYTRSGIRLVGPEPKNNNLIYNLGCNGIGIMPSIYAAHKISLMLTGKKFKPSIFDPK